MYDIVLRQTIITYYDPSCFVRSLSRAKIRKPYVACNIIK